MKNGIKLMVAAIMTGMFCVQSARAIDREDILFYCDFSTNTDAVLCNGDGKAQVDRDIESSEGKLGSGMLLRRRASLRWKTKDNILPKRGAVEFWVRFTASGRDGRLFEMFGKKAAFIDHSSAEIRSSGLIQDTGTETRKEVKDLILYCAFYNNNPVMTFNNWTAWRIQHRLSGKIVRDLTGLAKGPTLDDKVLTSWHHVAMCWEGGDGETSFWLDGQKTRMWNVMTEVLTGDDFGLGPVGAECVFDELYVYRRPLSDAEVKSAFKRPDRFKSGREGPKFFAPTPAAAPVIDGKLPEGDWDLCSSAVMGMVSALTGELASRQMLLQFCHDDKTLYLAASDVENMWGKCSSAAGDRLSILTARKPVLTIDASGKCDNPGVKVASSFIDNKWIVEMAIPLSLLQYAEGKPLQLDVTRQYENMKETTCLGSGAFPFEKGAGSAIALQKENYPSVRLTGIKVDGAGRVSMEIGVPQRGVSQVKATLETNPGAGENSVRRNVTTSPNLDGVFHWPLRRLNAGVEVDPESTESLRIKVEALAGATGVLQMDLPFAFARKPGLKAVDGLLDQVVELEADAGGNVPEGAKVEADIVDPINGKIVAHGVVDKFNGGYGTTVVDVAQIPAGDYRVVGKFIAQNGAVAGTAEALFRKWTKLGWQEAAQLGNNDGIVMKPWTPIAMNKDTAQIWGREVTIGPNGLPSKMVSQKRDVLAGPIVIEAVAGGKPLAPVGSPKLEAKPDKLTAEAKLSGAAGDIDVKTVMEYDGFIWVDIVPGKNVSSLDRLTVTIPLKKEVASLCMWDTFKYDSNVNYEVTLAAPKSDWGAVPDTVAKPWSPYIFLHDDQVGFCFLAENAEGWAPANEDSVVTLKKEGDQAVLKVEIIGKTTAKEDIKPIGFALQATPVRPVPNYRVEKWGKTGRANRWLTGSEMFDGVTPQYPAVGSFRLRDESAYRSMMAMTGRGGMNIIPYNSSIEHAMGDRDLRQRIDLLRGLPGSFAAGPDLLMLRACKNCKEYRDKKVWDLHMFLEKTQGDAVYMDDSEPLPCYNSQHGCGWKDQQGKIHHTISYRQIRDMAKRMHKVFLDHNREPYIVWHMASATPQVAAYGGFALGGEDLLARIDSAHTWEYPKSCPPDVIRARLVSAAFGVAVICLTEPCRTVPYDWPNDPENMSELTWGYLQVHDVWPWPNYVKDATVQNGFKVWDAFGISDKEVEFMPYWDSKGEFSVTPGPQEALVSVYKKKDKVLFVVVNLTDKETQVSVKFDAKKLGFQNANPAGKDLFLEENVPVQGDGFSVKLKKRGFRAVEVK